VYQRFCIWPLGDPTLTVDCGWGTGGSYGINHGF
jgi:hypothetical protein